ncbi:MAG: hypothetical protein ABIA92_01345 [Patescibacteria group bacterium]
MKQNKFGITGLALAALVFCGTSVGGLASISTFQWVGTKDADSYYPTDQLHSSAQTASYPIAWIALLLVAFAALLYVYILHRRQKNHK